MKRKSEKEHQKKEEGRLGREKHHHEALIAARRWNEKNGTRRNERQRQPTNELGQWGAEGLLSLAGCCFVMVVFLYAQLEPPKSFHAVELGLKEKAGFHPPRAQPRTSTDAFFP